MEENNEKNVTQEVIEESNVAKEKDLKKCLNCGAVLEQDENFCSKCGTRYGETKKIICSKCGNEIEFGKKFCGKCGEKVNVNTAERIEFTKNNFTKNNVGKKLIIIIIAIIVLLGVFFAGKTIYTRLSISIDELISQERYSEAYKKSKTDEEKYDVINEMIKKGKFEEAYNLSGNENIAFINELAYYCNEISENLKDPTSFVLRDVYYDKSEQKIVFCVNGSNSYGGTVVGYWYYTYNTTKAMYELYTYVSDLDQESTYSWDTSSEILEKSLKNLARIEIKSIMGVDNNKVDNEVIDSINTLFKNETLKKVEFPNYLLETSDSAENT